MPLSSKILNKITEAEAEAEAEIQVRLNSEGEYAIEDGSAAKR